MTDVFPFIFCVVAGAFCERLRGGWPPFGPAGSDDGAGRARALRSTLLAGLAYALGAPASVCALLFVTLWASLLNSHADYWKCETWGQAAHMAALGAIRGLGGLLPLMIWHSLHAPYGDGLLLYLCAALPLIKPLFYGGAWRLRARLPSRQGLLDDWNAYAELAWGAAVGAALWALTGAGS